MVRTSLSHPWVPRLQQIEDACRYSTPPVHPCIVLSYPPSVRPPLRLSPARHAHSRMRVSTSESKYPPPIRRRQALDVFPLEAATTTVSPSALGPPVPLPAQFPRPLPLPPSIPLSLSTTSQVDSCSSPLSSSSFMIRCSSCFAYRSASPPYPPPFLHQLLEVKAQYPRPLVPNHSGSARVAEPQIWRGSQAAAFVCRVCVRRE